MNNAISNAIATVGSQTKLAIELKVTPQAVYGWVSGKSPLPIKRAIQIEKLTGINRAQLRPDIFSTQP